MVFSFWLKFGLAGLVLTLLLTLLTKNEAVLVLGLFVSAICGWLALWFDGMGEPLKFAESFDGYWPNLPVAMGLSCLAAGSLLLVSVCRIRSLAPQTKQLLAKYNSPNSGSYRPNWRFSSKHSWLKARLKEFLKHLFYDGFSFLFYGLLFFFASKTIGRLGPVKRLIAKLRR
ncbi:MAG: hypothetical protein A2750_01285 [Candidatus Yanofskybacteria bacterium RIFCSPHIGHO2_01_FULL_45_42]|uniref:Uncharacterized protein n=3 Tax=Candidatus Yanofskyibacteriota TaxID=1752733 RepID=A0A1F8F520_9BACT|nr:MAG: hypothetical protein A2750_01285 [Candidatus Yanofskybacteria bacterium RIFCSPHIGHO2_01_FULL_45_42]OGN16602.1 MAG: hypothetical protein A3C81_02440 [Candidatus Yanofskybacteria bacterium RIFCSPHIGHO2_02_FULL_46_19]OGN26574.1 MAG: hypothetical protein A3B17_00775 [Candidatus Yanofskybacteria bacterium RIFCSPLOWO2_01_FULL_45_72]OGN32630.1 MAG: hypothetical protein A3J01_01560 [Candidatus Yanofskybacteria bacterium RIFCSPLOWO2_02_FULL_45_18]